LPRVKEVYALLNELSAFELQESWDNSGLNVGNLENQYREIVLSLDIDLDLIKRLEHETLIITHHPLIFKSLKTINTAEPIGQMIQEMMKRDITLIAMHTNYDKTHLNRYVLEEVLGYEVSDEEDFILYFEPNKRFNEFFDEVVDKLSLNYPNFQKSHDFIKKAALTTGSGMDLLPMVHAELFLTGDIKYHQSMDAKARGVSLIDIDHYESEKFFANSLQKELRKFQLLAKIEDSGNPFLKSI
jgi:dinuclear metal center YbgI/SA1388 family protein